MILLAVTLTLVTLLGALPAPDLVDDLDKAGEAEFVGRQLVVCWAPDGTVAQVTDIEQSGGMTMVTGPDGSFVIGEGKMIEQYAGGIEYLEMTPTTHWRLWDGYTVRDGENRTGLADVRVIEILEDDAIRARFVLDEATSAPLTTEVYGRNEALYRYSSLIEFRPREDEPMLDMSDMPEPERRPTRTAATVPALAGHYWAADTYSAPGGVHVFFTDGLFRFSVFEVDRKSDGGGLAKLPAVDIGGAGGYHRQHTPGAVSVFWRTPDLAYILVGDLPPDQLDAVLADLPTPSRPNLLKRAWRWAFG
ncbi:MAG: hypothetical protein OEP52_00670 [Acidimicrobiia bacterium]|nr:hypothetical protein [Acidimicrobiia bacterium]